MDPPKTPIPVRTSPPEPLPPVRAALRWISDRPRTRAVPVQLLLLLGVFLLDDVTHAELSVSIFYLLPLTLATWTHGYWGGALMGGMCTALAVGLSRKHPQAYSHDVFRYWDGVVHVLFFAVVVVLLAELRRAYRRYAEQARQDPLTGLANRRRFDELTETEMVRSSRTGLPFTVVYMDADDFKRLNDLKGHGEGDRLLQAVAGRLSRLRRTDVAARLGGDEFAVLMPDTTLGAAHTVVKKLKADLDAEMAAHGWAVTFSVGAVAFDVVPKELREVLHVADALMYQVKRSTKNAVALASWNGALEPAAADAA